MGYLNLLFIDLFIRDLHGRGMKTQDKNMGPGGICKIKCIEFLGHKQIFGKKIKPCLTKTRL